MTILDANIKLFETKEVALIENFKDEIISNISNIKNVESCSLLYLEDGIDNSLKGEVVINSEDTKEAIENYLSSLEYILDFEILTIIKKNSSNKPSKNKINNNSNNDNNNLKTSSIKSINASNADKNLNNKSQSLNNSRKPINRQSDINDLLVNKEYNRYLKLNLKELENHLNNVSSNPEKVFIASRIKYLKIENDLDNIKNKANTTKIEFENDIDRFFNHELDFEVYLNFLNNFNPNWNKESEEILTQDSNYITNLNYFYLKELYNNENLLELLDNDNLIEKKKIKELIKLNQEIKLFKKENPSDYQIFILEKKLSKLSYEFKKGFKERIINSDFNDLDKAILKRVLTANILDTELLINFQKETNYLSVVKTYFVSDISQARKDFDFYNNYNYLTTNNKGNKKYYKDSLFKKGEVKFFKAKIIEFSEAQYTYNFSFKELDKELDKQEDFIKNKLNILIDDINNDTLNIHNRNYLLNQNYHKFFNELANIQTRYNFTKEEAEEHAYFLFKSHLHKELSIQGTLLYNEYLNKDSLEDFKAKHLKIKGYKTRIGNDINKAVTQVSQDNQDQIFEIFKEAKTAKFNCLLPDHKSRHNIKHPDCLELQVGNGKVKYIPYIDYKESQININKEAIKNKISEYYEDGLNIELDKIDHYLDNYFDFELVKNKGNLVNREEEIRKELLNMLNLVAQERNKKLAFINHKLSFELAEFIDVEYFNYDVIKSEQGKIYFENLDKEEVNNFIKQNNLGIELEHLPEQHSEYNLEYLAGNHLNLSHNLGIYHGMTGVETDDEAYNRLEKLLETGSLKSTAMRRQEAIDVESMSPICDIVSGIDDAVPFKIGNSINYGSHCFFLLKDEMHYHDDIFYSDRDFGAGTNRYQLYNEYAKSLNQETIHNQANLNSRQQHLSKISDLVNEKCDDNEILFRGEVDFNKVDSIILNVKKENQELFLALIDDAKEKNIIPQDLNVEFIFYKNQFAGVIKKRMKHNMKIDDLL